MERQQLKAASQLDAAETDKLPTLASQRQSPLGEHQSPTPGGQSPSPQRFHDQKTLREFAREVLRSTKYDNRITGNTFFDDAGDF